MQSVFNKGNVNMAFFSYLLARDASKNRERIENV